MQFKTGPERIKHYICNNHTPLIQFLSEQSQLSHGRIEFLLNLGAIYHNGKRVAHNINLCPGDYLRLHIDPRRFPIEKLNPDSLIVWQDEHILIVDKPAGIPIHPTLDNQEENLAAVLSKTLKQELFVTQRLDMGTSGLIILAKNKLAQKKINLLLSQREIIKKYLSLTLCKPPLGLLTHYMKPHPRAPKTLDASIHPLWLPCHIHINKVTDLWTNEQNFFLSEIQLLTGRTHQIRAQLSFIDCPIIGDEMYHGVQLKNKPTEEWFALQSYSLALQWEGEKLEFALPQNPDFLKIKT